MDYCSKDVLALEYIYKEFSLALFKISPVPMSLNISLAAQAMEMWKQIEDKKMVESICIPPNMEQYNIFKSMYHGGRVLLTLARYDTQSWLNAGMDPYKEEQSNYNMDSDCSYKMTRDVMEEIVEDELKMLDVVSLYPSVMKKHLYPTGKYHTHILTSAKQQELDAKSMMDIISRGKYETIGRDGDDLLRIENELYDPMKEIMFRTCYLVDMHIDKPIIVAFLIRKNLETNSPEQSLAPFAKYWVTGVELFEAIRIGYVVDRIYQKIAWASKAPLFKTYIEKLFKIKEDNKKVSNS